MGCRRAQGWSKKVLAPMTWGALSEARFRRRSLGDMAVIIVSAAAIQANTPLIHAIQADTDDTYDTVICIQYSYIHTMANQQKTIYLT